MENSLLEMEIDRGYGDYFERRDDGEEVVIENMNRCGAFWGLWDFRVSCVFSFLCAQANSIAGCQSKSMGVASLNTKTMLSMFLSFVRFSLCRFLFSVTTSSTSSG